MKKLFIAVLVCMALIGCGKKDAEIVKVAVGTWKTQQTIQPFFYQQFLPENILCEVKPFTNPGDMKTALLAGSLDMCGTTLVHAIVSAVRGEPVVLVAALCNKCSALVVGADSGVESVQDLKGRKIGYVPSTMHHILLLQTLHNAGLSPEDVELIRVDFFDMHAALARRQIDAFLSGEPFPTQAAASGAGRILAYPYFHDSVGTINAGMIVRRDLLETNPELVQALVDAHVNASMALMQDSEQWLAAAAEFGSDKEILRAAASNIELAWNMDQTFVAQVKRLGDLMLERGMIERLPDWKSLIDTRFVEKAGRGGCCPHGLCYRRTARL